MTTPQRKRVMSPERRAALGLPPASPVPRPATPAPTGPDSLAALTVTLRVQRRLALRTMTLLIGGLTALAAVLASAPALGHARLAGVPLSWLILGVAVYAALVLLARRHRRAADRLEAALGGRDARHLR